MSTSSRGNMDEGCHCELHSVTVKRKLYPHTGTQVSETVQKFGLHHCTPVKDALGNRVTQFEWASAQSTAWHVHTSGVVHVSKEYAHAFQCAKHNCLLQRAPESQLCLNHTDSRPAQHAGSNMMVKFVQGLTHGNTEFDIRLRIVYSPTG